ncbi:hypothetical protein [Methylobacterium soli]|uniref:Helix-turn-helix domain-containing protein n=1 Tax=Methylobacterium soli TaxID=553447 RepID=A0A6L3T2E6_9HYPH|nr:hypothetical protein [Methylobacterium soli]KAB1080908.1 hypothetical protein F6X53_04270 [Methylobacterium soli]GJE44631.1 hypothetical protein AEGHOMDF_3820 [Methylobacterium soli]
MTENSRTRRGVDLTGRSTGAFKDPRFRKFNKPPKGVPFAWITLPMLRSPAWRAMSRNARLVVERVMVEHMSHGGNKNGALPVTYNNFEEYGIRRNSVKKAIDEAIELGFIAISEKGTRAWGEYAGHATTFRLAWLPTIHGDMPESKWSRFADLASAEAASARVRLAGIQRRSERANHSGAPATGRCRAAE